MGFALFGLQRFGAARDFFRGAIDLNPRQANAYYRLAEANEALGELPEAMGAMRVYLHLAEPAATHRSKARAALWEWEARIGPGRSRGPAAGTAASPAGSRPAPAPRGGSRP